MLEPKKVKFRRHHRGNRRGVAKGGNYVISQHQVQRFIVNSNQIWYVL